MLYILFKETGKWEISMTKRQEKAQVTKRKLIDTGLDLLKEKGFEAINVEDITKAAGVSKGTFYTYFKRKEDIVYEISRAPFADIINEINSMKDKPLIERLTHYFRRFMERVEFAGVHVCRQWVRDVLDPKNVPDNKDSSKLSFDVEMLKNILSSAVENNDLSQDTPVETLTYIIISTLYGMMTLWCMSDKEFEPLDWIDRFASVELLEIIRPYK